MDNSCFVRVSLLCVFVVSFIVSHVLEDDSNVNSNQKYCLIKLEQDFLMFPNNNFTVVISDTYQNINLSNISHNIVLYDICQIIKSNNNFSNIVSGQYFDKNKFAFVDNSKIHLIFISIYCVRGVPWWLI